MLAAAVADYDEAERHFAEALAIHRRMQAPFWSARVQIEQARMLLARNARGDTDLAAALLAETDVVAARFGFAALTRQANELRP